MIQKIIHQTWVGDKPSPKKWMDTWKRKNPKWSYMLWDNKTIEKLDIKCKKQFDYYWNKKIWHGVADIVRYHALYEYGGFQPGADSVCLRPIDDLFGNGFDLFTFACYANYYPRHWIREDGVEDDTVPNFMDKKDKVFWGLVAPIHGSKKGHPFLKLLIDEISSLEELGSPWKTTGNLLCSKMIKKHKPEIVIYPMHYFTSKRKARAKPPIEYIYVGNDKVYADHFWLTTNIITNKNK